MDSIRRVVDALTMSLNVIGTIGIVLLMVLINVDVIGRAFFDRPVSGVPEMVSLSIVAIVFLQIAQAYRNGRLTRSDAFLGWLRKQSPRGAELLELLFSIAALILIGVLYYASQGLFVKAWQRDTYVGTVGDFIAPIWPVKLILLIGCVALILQILMRVAENLRFLRTGQTREQPVADHDTI